MNDMNDPSDGIIGCIVGGAIGDAMGSPWEGGENRGPVLDGVRWRTTDDTQLTLATCEAIVMRGSPDPDAMAERFAAWFRERRVTGMGASTLKALRELAAGGHWALVGRKGEMAAGNGAAMRAAPLAFMLDPEREQDRSRIRDISRITHHSDEAYAGALAVIAAVRLARSGMPDDMFAFIHAVAGSLPDSNVRDRLLELAAIDPDGALADVVSRFGNSGYVAESVPFAILASLRVREMGFEGVLAEIIRSGGDTDTNASIAGQIMGTMLGYRGLPAGLVQRLPGGEMILSMAQAFSSVVAGREEG